MGLGVCRSRNMVCFWEEGFGFVLYGFKFVSFE